MTGIPRQGGGAGRRYRLGDGLRLVDRGDDGLQIGTDPIRRVLLRNPPIRAHEVLGSLNGRRRLSQLLAEGDTDLQHWTGLLDRLSDGGFIGHGDTTGSALGRGEERAHLAQRHGADLAELLLGRRADAIVEVRGTGRVASTLAWQLAAAGIGHLHHAADRPVRDIDLLPGDQHGSGTPGAGAGAEPVDDADRLAARLRSVAPRIDVRTPAGHQRPTLVVLAGDGPADAAAARELMERNIPHLAAWSSATRAVVGPLVLPGLSSCLWCAELARTDADAGWPLVRYTVNRHPQTPPAVLATGAAALAAADVLNLVDAVCRPASVDGTLEWDAAGLPRRRSWSRHPQCPCHGAAPG